MPFIVTITPPRCSAQGGRGFHCPRPANATYCEICGTTNAAATHAVATIEDARYRVQVEIEGTPAPIDLELRLMRDAARLTESGGRIELPDGTVIDVRPIGLCRSFGTPSDQTRRLTRHFGQKRESSTHTTHERTNQYA